MGVLLFRTIMPTVSLEDATYADAVFIARRMREWDAKEILPVMLGSSHLENLALGVSIAEYSKCAFWNGKPVSVFGASPLAPLSYSVFMYATDDWPHVALSVTRHIKKVMLPYYAARGANRAECRTHGEYLWAHRWLEFMGAHKESEIKDYGAQRMTYFMYVWCRSLYEGN